MKRVALLVAFTLVAPLALAGSGPTLWNFYLIPAAASVAGAQGTYWRTDLSIVNPHEHRSIAVTVALLQADRADYFPAERSYTIPAKGERRVTDVVGSAFSTSGNGALMLYTSDGAVFAASARTYTGSSSTYGQTELGQDWVNVGGARAFTSGIRHDGAFRTNVGAVNASDRGISLLAEVFDSGGALRGSTVLDLQAWSQTQVSLSTFSSSVSSGYVRWTCQTSGTDLQWVAYASVVDNASGDAVFVEETRDSLGTHLRPGYDLTGWWSGSYSFPGGSSYAVVYLTQTEAYVHAYLFDDVSGRLEMEVAGWESQGSLSFEDGFVWVLDCLNDGVSSGSATTNGGSINGSLYRTGLCMNGWVNFTLYRAKSAPFGDPGAQARAETLLGRGEAPGRMRLSQRPAGR